VEVEVAIFLKNGVGAGTGDQFHEQIIRPGPHLAYTHRRKVE